MGGMSGVADQDEVAVGPALAKYAPEIEPGLRPGQVPRVRHQPGTTEIAGEDALAERDRLRLVHPIKPQKLPGLRRHLHDEGRMLLVEAIGMGPDPAGLGPLEGEGEGFKGLACAEPEELVSTDLHVDAELLLVNRADAAVRAVGGDDEVVI